METYHISRKTRPSVRQKVSGWDFTVRKTKAEDTGWPSLQTNRRSLLMMSAIWSVFSPPLRRARTNSMASSIFIADDLPSQTPDSVIEIVAENLERSYLGGIGYVCSNASAGIIVTYPDYP